MAVVRQGADRTGEDNKNHEETMLVPINKEYQDVLDKFDRERFEYGNLVSIEWLKAAFGIEDKKEVMTEEEYKEQQFKYWGCVGRLKDILLEHRKMALKSVYGEGYKIIKPSEQTRWAEEEGYASMRKSLDTMVRRQKFVNHSQLTVDERRENADALARSAQLEMLVRRSENRLFNNSLTQLSLEA